MSRICILSFQKMSGVRKCNGVTHSDLALPLGLSLSSCTLLKLHREADVISDGKWDASLKPCRCLTFVSKADCSTFSLLSNRGGNKTPNRKKRNTFKNWMTYMSTLSTLMPQRQATESTPTWIFCPTFLLCSRMWLKLCWAATSRTAAWTRDCSTVGRLERAVQHKATFSIW